MVRKGQPGDPGVQAVKGILDEAAWAACEGRGFAALAHARAELGQVRGSNRLCARVCYRARVCCVCVRIPGAQYRALYWYLHFSRRSSQCRPPHAAGGPLRPQARPYKAQLTPRTVLKSTRATPPPRQPSPQLIGVTAHSLLHSWALARAPADPQAASSSKMSVQVAMRFRAGGALLLDCLSPQLRAVLLAELALGLLVPG